MPPLSQQQLQHLKNDQKTEGIGDESCRANHMLVRQVEATHESARKTAKTKNLSIQTESDE